MALAICWARGAALLARRGILNRLRHIPRARHNTTAAFSRSGGFAGSTSATLTQVATHHAMPVTGRMQPVGLDLTSAQLPGANLTGTNHSRTHLTSTNLSGVNLSAANLKGPNLSRANLNGADLSGATVADADFGKGAWSDTTCPDGTNINADGGPAPATSRPDG